MYHSTKHPACPYNVKNAEKAHANKTTSVRSAGKETVSKPPSVNSAAETQKIQSARPPQKFDEGYSVYDENDRDGSGRPKRKRYWICCVRWSESRKKRIYKLKDAPYPHGKDVRWVEENYLHEWHV